MVNCLFDVGFLQILCSCGYHRCNIRCVYIYIYLLIYLFIICIIFIHALFMPGIGPNAGIVSVPTCRWNQPIAVGFLRAAIFLGSKMLDIRMQKEQANQAANINQSYIIVYHWNSLSTISSFMFLPCVQSSVNPSVISLAIVGSPCRPGESGCAWVMLGFDTALHMSRHVTTFSW